MSKGHGVDFGPRYRPVRELGRGGTGAVHLVRDAYLDRDVALKLLRGPSLSDEALASLEREYRLLSEVEHPGIAKAWDFGFLDGRPYFTSEFVDGQSAATPGLLRGPHELLDVLEQVASAVAFLHEHGILHLDIKPGNIVVAREGPRLRAVLVDFGLCRRGGAHAASGPPRGSLPFMGPEFFRDEPLGPWTDVYALGVTAYLLATGTLPREGASAAGGAAVRPGGWTVPVPPSSRDPTLPPDLDHAILRCVAIEPEARYAKAGELAGALRRIAGRSDEGARTRPEVSRLVGRDPEREAFDRFLDRLEGPAGASRGMLVTGPPGMGQTRLLHELRTRAQVRGFRCSLQQGYPGFQGPPGALLEGLAREVPARSSRGRARWASFLADLRRPRAGTTAEATDAERRLRRLPALGRLAAALRGPTLLLVDGLQHFDEISIALLIDLIRVLGDPGAAGRRPLGVVAGYREEGPSASLLHELTDLLLSSPGGEPIVLGPLGLRPAVELYRAHRRSSEGGEAADAGPEIGALPLLERTGGRPGAIVALACRGRHGGDDRPGTGGPTVGARELSAAERRTFEVLVALGRPAGPREVARIAGLDPRRTSRALAGLVETGRARDAVPSSGVRGWVADPSISPEAPEIPPGRRRRLHARIAKALLAEGGIRPEAPRLLEAVGHLRLAGKTAAFVGHGLAAARYLAATFQNRAALALLESILEALPADSRTRRVDAILLLAEVRARTGGHDEGIRLLGDLLSGTVRLSPAARARAILRLATLHGRRGDFQRADALFAEGLPLARALAPRIRRNEVLFFVDEHASVKAFLGQHAEALRLCEEGLRLAGRSMDPGVRELALSLLATRANVALRTFDFAAAERDFEDSLAIAEAIGSRANQATILSNLGILHSQCDRYPEAVRAYTEAERLCVRLDEAPSLASILGNLAVLHSKRGEHDLADRALARASRLGGDSMAQRQRMFLEHSRGLCELYRGRYAAARPRLEEAILLARSMGDSQVATFDRVYLAEALIHLSRYAEAAEALEELSRGEPRRSASAALARLAFLRAMTARHDAARDAVSRRGAIETGRPVPFLDAWDSLYVGWALELGPSGADAEPFLSASEEFFRRCGLRPGLALAAWIRAEGCFVRGEPGRSRRILDGSAGPANDLTAVLYPLLRARLVLELDSREDGEMRCADLLAKAGSALVGNPLPEWDVRLAALRAALAGPDAAAAREFERRRAAVASSLAEEDRAAYLRSAHWLAWRPRRRVRRGPRPGSGRPAGERVRPRPSADVETTVLAGSPAVGPRSALVARSAAMRGLVATLDRLRDSDLPVLIQGETGSGKELVARTIHAESRRARGPFQAIDCGAIPAALLEAELFGSRAGAFTGSRGDRRGLLPRAEGGTVLLDEVAGLGLEVQAKLLRAIGEGTVRPVGSDEQVRIDVRFLASTAHDLEKEAEAGRFRRDLLYRIAVVSVRVPPLRERAEDLPGLVAALLAKRGGRGDRTEPPPGEPPSIDAGAFERLRRWRWPGNVRELENVLWRLRLEGRASVTAEAVDRILADTSASSVFPRTVLESEPLDALRARLELDYIAHHFRRLEGDADALCKLLGLSRRQLYRRCERLGLSLRRERRKLDR